MKVKNNILGIRRMTDKQKKEIIKKVRQLDDIGQRLEIRLYCPICKTELLWWDVYNDLATSMVHWHDDCKHYYWDYFYCDPELPDENDWKCQLEKKHLEKVKDRITYVVSDVGHYLVLIREQ
jgi:hypothetical protein